MTEHDPQQPTTMGAPRQPQGQPMQQRPQRRGLTRKQLIDLMSPVRADLIEQKQRMSYVPQHEIRAALIRIFGPGNVDHTMHPPVLNYDYRVEKGQPGFPKDGKAPFYYITSYTVGCTLRIRDYWGNPVAEFTEYHSEENAPLPNRGEAHAMAITSAQSYALRRAAISLGDAFGLHLYDKGSQNAIVVNTNALDDPEAPGYRAPRPPQQPQAPAGAPNAQPPANQAQAPVGDAQAAAGGALAAGFAHPEGRQG